MSSHFCLIAQRSRDSYIVTTIGCLQFEFRAGFRTMPIDETGWGTEFART